MSCANGGCTCGCCTGLGPVAAVTNRPGLPALSYRIGTYTDFFARMSAQIASPSLLASPPESGGWPIARLSTRSTDDPAIALLDAWAVVLDVLSFYQERIANEGFLRTATERRSVLELAREIGYELDPGVAASTYLSFLIEDVIGTPPPVSIPQTPRTPSAPTQGGATYNLGTVQLDAGTQVQSVPPQNQLPQTFETSSPLAARTAWNLVLPRMTRFADYALTATGTLVMIDLRVNFAPGTPVVQLDGTSCYLLNESTPMLPAGTQVNAVGVDHVYVDGVSTGLSLGDLLMLVGVNGSGQVVAGFQHVFQLTADVVAGRTRIDFDSAPAADPGFALKSFPTNAVPGTPLPLTQANVDKYILLASITESDLQALIGISGWDPTQLATMVNSAPETGVAGAMGIYSFGSEASFFGNNAPLWKSLPKPDYQRSDPYPSSWDDLHGGAGPLITQTSQGSLYGNGLAYLERSMTVTPGSLGVLEDNSGDLAGVEITSANDRSLADYSLSGKSTGVTFQLIAASGVQQFSNPVAALLNSGNVAVFGTAGGSVYQMQSATAASSKPTLRLSGSFPASATAIANYPSALEVFAVDGSGNLIHTNLLSESSGVWYGPFTIGTGYRGKPTVATAVLGTPFSNVIDVFVASVDNELVHFWYNTDQPWSGPEVLSSKYSIGSGGAPVLVKDGPSSLEVFFINASGILMHAGYPHPVAGAPLPTWWGPLSVLGYQNVSLRGTPTASLFTPGHPAGQKPIDVFAHGLDGHLHHAWYINNAWNGLEDLGAPATVSQPSNGVTFVGDPCLVENGPSALEVLSIGTDGNLYTTWWTAGSWHGPVSLGGDGQLVGSPSAVSANGQIWVVASAKDGTVFQIQYATQGTSSAWSGLVSLGGGLSFYTRTSKLHFDSQQQPLGQPPITDIVAAGSLSVQLNGFLPGLSVGQAVALTGQHPATDAAGVTGSEIVLLTGIAHHGGFTELQIASPGLQFSYIRNTLTLNINTVLATNGASIPVTEILGGGDATQANQSFVLSRTALTYVPAATATGSISTLTIRVNGIEWKEAPTLYDLGPNDRNYILREDDTGTVTVTFGDGICGARLPTGQNNISAQYRTGIGVAGNVAAGTLSVLQSRPPGLRSVNNAVPASGGADPQVLADARTNAPRTVLTLDRIVSVEDYENFAATFAGIGKAQAVLLPLSSAEFQVIHITLSGGGGAAVDATSDLFVSLAAAIDAMRDPGPFVHIRTYTPALFNLSAQLILDPAYIAADVLASAGAAVSTAFSFANRDFAQPVLAAEAIAILQAVEGVVAVELSLLRRNSGTYAPTDPLVMPVLVAAAAGIPAGSNPTTVSAVFAAITPAELLLLNPVGLTLTEKTS
ncbi:putative baseplate assembly protein [Granulicella sp. WH15]|uniref:putative baseplate assembly protein n=1 Tax=Granulicella sp. WH15 TaxID=2602070 RepID=UPI0013672850|nr:putative baseplate assembly protein [Granulicella sp. WH15]QHN04115.1 putative baseplate assembly protein [Granulicella sp. WH15]